MFEKGRSLDHDQPYDGMKMSIGPVAMSRCSGGITPEDRDLPLVEKGVDVGAVVQASFAAVQCGQQALGRFGFFPSG